MEVANIVQVRILSNTKFDIVEVDAVSVEAAIRGYLEDDYFDREEITSFGEYGRYAGESHTIGIGITKEAAVLQYIESRMENG